MYAIWLEQLETVLMTPLKDIQLIPEVCSHDGKEWWAVISNRFLGCSRSLWRGHLQRRERKTMLVLVHELSLDSQRKFYSFFPFFPLQSGKNRIIKENSSRKLVDLERRPFPQNSFASRLHVPALDVMPFAEYLGLKAQRGETLHLWTWWPFWEPLPKSPPKCVGLNGQRKINMAQRGLEWGE